MMLCTGNPAHQTIASGIKKKFPEAEFASRATGYDLRFWTPGSEDYFCERIKNYNVFVNSSFICGNGQLTLLETTWNVWSQHGISGHIINIGSSSEFIGVFDPKTDINVYGIYSIQKRSLRDRSLQLNNKKNIRTTHMILGGINDGKTGHSSWLDLTIISDTIYWILKNPADIPLIYLESKQVDQ